MAVYYKFKSAKDYDSIAMDGPFISVGTLKDKIFESKHLGSGKDFDLVVTNAQTNEEYLDEAMLIPKNTSVLIRRVPGRPRMPIVTGQELNIENKVEKAQPDNTKFSEADSSATKYPEHEWDEFGNDLYSIPDVPTAQSSNPLPDAIPTNDTADEDSKIQALIDTPALDWQLQDVNGLGPRRGYGRGMGGRMGGRGFGMERKMPPQGYVCHRCNIPGHFIQHCPTNGDPIYDIKRVKPPTGIPKSMLMANPDGSYALPSGAVAALRPNEDAFEKEMEGLPSTRSVGELPPELRCPVCNEVLKDAVLTSKCCFKSFCDKCIRDHIISKSMCVCGATDILADDLLPNKTLRDTINRILESGNCSAGNAGSTDQVQDVESARCVPPKVPSPATSAASKGEQKAPPSNNVASIVIAATEPAEAMSTPQLPVETIQAAKPVAACEAINESISVKEEASQGSARVPKEGHQQMASGEQGKKKKKKKAHLHGNDLAAPNYMMSMSQSAFNPCWNGIQAGLCGFMGPYPGPMHHSMGYGPGPLDMPFGGVMPLDPFLAQGFGFPGMPPPHRDLAQLGMGMTVPRPTMSREEFEARKADMRRKLENERRGERGDLSRNRENGREANGSMDSSPMKSKARPVPQAQSGRDNPYYDRQRRERLSTDMLPSKRRSESHEGSREREYDYHDLHRRSEERKSSVVARKKRKVSSSSSSAALKHRSRKEVAVSTDYDSCDEDRHFKRRPSRYGR